MIIDPYTWHQLPIQHLTQLTPDTLSVRVPKPAKYTYRAGQYAVVRVNIGGAPVLRQYSYASSPGNDFLEFLIQREPGGTVSGWFHGVARIGTTIDISQALGSFTAPVSKTPLLLIAGRVGIAPILSIVREQLDHENGDAITLLYSARGKDGFCYRELLETIGAKFFDTLHNHRIDRQILSDHLTPAADVYLCGSKQFVDSLAAELGALGVPPEHIRRELFTLQ